MAQPTGILANSGDVVQAPAGASCLITFDQVQAGGPVVYEGSLDGFTFPYALTAYPLGGGAGETGRTLAAGQSAALVLDTLGLALVRVRATGAVGGAQVWIVPTTVPFPGSGGGGGASTAQGPAAEGAAASGNPVRVAGWDGTNLRTLHTDLSGNLAIAGTGIVNDSVGGSAEGLAQLGATTVIRPMASGLFAFDGTFWMKQRVPAVFKSAAATAAGNTALWTPAAGKKFRLMRFKVQVTANAILAAAGVLALGLQDATTDLNLTHSVFVPAAAGTTMAGFFDSGWVDLGNGVLSALANNILNVNLSAALTGGTCRVLAVGTEE